MRLRFSLQGLLIGIAILSVCLAGLRWLLNYDWTLVQEIALPKDRAVKVRTEAFEDGQPYYAEVWNSGQMVSRCYIFSVGGTPPWALEFHVETAAGGELIGLTERRAPNVLLMAHDFRTGLSWPRPEAFDSWRQTALRGETWAAELSAASGRDLQKHNIVDGRGLESRAEAE